MEFLQEYGLFLAQALTLVVAILAVAAGFVILGSRQRAPTKGHIEIQDLNKRYKDIGESLRDVMDEPEARKLAQKASKKAEKAKAKSARKKAAKSDAAAPGERKRLYVLDFDGDLKASATDHRRE